jgi:hypothetical protein
LLKRPAVEGDGMNLDFLPLILEVLPALEVLTAPEAVLELLVIGLQSDLEVLPLS